MPTTHPNEQCHWREKGGRRVTSTAPDKDKLSFDPEIKRRKCINNYDLKMQKIFSLSKASIDLVA
jgi:hypothetical protein